MRIRFIPFSRLLWLCLGFSLLSSMDKGFATAVTYVGKEIGVGGEDSYDLDYPVQRWSHLSTHRLYTTVGNQRYGTAGYYQIRPTPTNSPSNVYEPSSPDIGVTAVNNPTLYSHPSFVESIVASAGSFVNFGNYQFYLGNDSSTVYRQGALSVSINAGPYDSPAGSGASYFGSALQFTLRADANFRIGLAVDSVGSGAYAPNYVGIYNSKTGTVFSALLTRDGTPDMVFFDISGSEGDSFTVALWQNAGAHSFAALSLVTFDIKQPFDMNPPLITLNGLTSPMVPWGDNYTDEGALVSNDLDIAGTISGIGLVNTIRPGTYEITFDTKGLAGNAATQVIRTVTVSAPSSTTGADGLSDLMRYALGGNAPGDSVAKPSSSVAGGYLVITAIVRTDNPKLTVVGEAVTNLDDYASGTSIDEVRGEEAADQDGVPVGSGSKRMRFSVPLEGSVAKKFLRLKASLDQ
jgi:hypothetical protein